jgi:hypothetical protein
MITAIHIENFKGIRERVKIGIKPITLLFGPNSAGKSTIVQAIHYAREILERGNLDPDRTMTGGGGVDLGGFRNFLHRTAGDRPELDRTIALRFDLDVTKSRVGALPEPGGDWWRELEDEGESDQGWMVDSLGGVEAAFVELRVRWSHLAERPIIVACAVGHHNRIFAVISYADDGSKPFISYIDETNHVIKAWRTNEGGDPVEQILEAFQAMSAEKKKELIDTLKSALLAETDSTPSATSEAEPDPFLSRQLPIEIPGLKTSIPQAHDVLRVTGSLAVDLFFTRAIVGPITLLREALAGFRYVGPVREVPPRHFAPSLTFEEAEWANGMAAWNRLAQDRELLAAASQWLAREDRLDTGYALRLKKTKELDLESPLALELMQWDEDRGYVDDPGRWFAELPTKHRLVLLKQPEDVELQPYDVGTGLSKMIPVVVAALDPRSGIVAIEEPESNIHPRWQVSLADLFISQALGHGQPFLLETHSEHLLLRIMRRIRDSNDGSLPHDLPPIRPNDVAVLYVESRERRSVVQRLELDDEGELLDAWPGGFFEEGFRERFR